MQSFNLTLYKELAETTPELKESENKLADVLMNKIDSTESFNKYNKKNNSYYSSTEMHIEGMKDSVMRNQMIFLISESMKKYQIKTSRHTDLLTTIDAKILTLNDLHTV